MVYWITGRRHSGKTTLAHKLAKQIKGGVVLDGDEFRQMFPEDFSKMGRFRNQRRMAKIARLLQAQGFTPIIACVSPSKVMRKALQSYIENCIEIQLPFGELWEGTTYEE